ncbi:hypothetical protein [Type-E symbiont of Plautia stali]|uniref:hypothetical protein n=1 Tax=Type-E symbiont of Plautia stali TaxID=1560357 RepID=UPI00073F91E9|nr:hypothetical protein [Type-E symbiont of Plautia stali]
MLNPAAISFRHSSLKHVNLRSFIMMSPPIQLGPTKAPIKFTQVEPVFLSDETMLERKNKVIQGMVDGGFDALVIYADKEHGGNFEYLTGFIPRFEEGLLIVDANGKCTAILGNENLKLARFSRVSVTLLHCPLFSLPNHLSLSVKK